MVFLQKEKFDKEKLIDSLKSENAGAILIFLGTTRKEEEGKVLKFLRYTAYEEMTLKTFKEIEEEAIEKFKTLKVIIAHRTGDVEPSDESMFIVVSSAHRKEGFKALRYIVDEVKKRAPIWKEGILKTGDSVFIENKMDSSD